MAVLLQRDSNHKTITKFFNQPIKNQTIMLDKNVAGLLNDQINKEFYSAYLYLEMANYFENRGLEGFAHWYEVQAKEECEHGMKIRNYLLDEEECVQLQTINAPKEDFCCDMDVLRKALAHEEYVTESINKIASVAFELHDYRTMQFLDWFIEEQAEEEVNARDMITKLSLYGEDAKGLYLLNHEQGKR